MSRKGIRYLCQWCGREKVAKDDPCPVCDGQPEFEPGPPHYECPRCKWEPPLDHFPRRSQQFCARCGTEMLIWQIRGDGSYKLILERDEEGSQCRQCLRPIESYETYCRECWQGWRNTPAGRAHFERRARKVSWDRSLGETWDRSSGASWEDQD